MNSIRVRLLCGIGLCLLVVFAVSGFLLYVYLHRVLESGFDASLLERANVFASTTEHKEGGALEFEFLEANLPQYGPRENPEYYQVWEKSGETVARSPSLGRKELPVKLPLPASPAFMNMVLPDGRPGKVVMLNFAPADGGSGSTGLYTLAIATSRQDLDRAFVQVANGMFLTGLTLILGAFPAVWWSVRRALGSIQTLGEQANTIRAENLSFRFPVENSPLELVPICTRLNSLLERLEAAFNRERRFTGDAAHELRTPIAELRTLAEVGLEEAAASAPAMVEYFEDTLGIALHLGSLVTTLLALTRCEAGLQKVELISLDAADVIRRVWDNFESRAQSKGIAVTVDVGDPALIETDEALFRAMLANILSNAVSYTPSGGEIQIVLQVRADSQILTFSNSSFEIKQQDLEQIFEPFWRKEQERSNASHCGVGLTLVAAYAQILGMTVMADIPSEGVFRVSLHVGGRN